MLAYSMRFDFPGSLRANLEFSGGDAAFREGVPTRGVKRDLLARAVVVFADFLGSIRLSWLGVVRVSGDGVVFCAAIKQASANRFLPSLLFRFCDISLAESTASDCIDSCLALADLVFTCFVEAISGFAGFYVRRSRYLFGLILAAFALQ